MDAQQEKNLVSNLTSYLEISSKFSDQCVKRLSRKPEVQSFVSRLLKADPEIFASILSNVVLSNIIEYFPILERTCQAISFSHGVALKEARKEAADARIANELAANEQEAKRATKRRRVGNEASFFDRRSPAAFVAHAAADETSVPGGPASAEAVNNAAAVEDPPVCRETSAGATDDVTADDDSSSCMEDSERSSPSSSVSSESARTDFRSRSRSMSRSEQAHLNQQASVQAESGESSRMAATRLDEPEATNDVSLFLNDEELELGITTAAPAALARVKETWKSMRDPRDLKRATFDCEREQNMVLNYAIKLDYIKLGRMLVEHLSDRVRIMSQSGHQPSIAELARLATNGETPLFQRFHALKSMTCRGKHDWIQRVYGEIRLWEDVQTAVKSRSDRILCTVNKSKISDHQRILKSMAREAAEKEGYIRQKDIDRVIGQFEKHFYAGLKWRTVAKDFNGSGIIIAFIVAGISSHTSLRVKVILTRRP